MVRNYVKKRSGPSYTPNDLEKAVNAVKSGSLTYNQAFEEFNVPKAVVFNRIKGRKTPMSCTKAGRSRVFSDEIELVLEKCLIARSKMGYPCDKNEFKELVGHFIKQSNFITPFKNGIPGDDWYYGFMKRHPKLSFKKPEQLQKVRKDARKPEVVYDFYEKLMDVVVANNMQNRPEFFFNADESGFHTDPSKLKAIGEKGQPLNRIVGGSGRESISVLACVSADGKYLPPLIVFKGCAVQARWTSPKAYPGTFYAVSKNGWMEESVFFNWFSKCFVHHVQQLRQYNNNESQTALLLFDGHCSHISIRILKSAIDNNIVLVKFPSHLTDKIQPLDKCVFGPLKFAWDKKLIQFGKQMVGKGVGRLTKGKFSELLGSVWLESMKSVNIISGFKNTGTFPVDSAMFPEDLFDPIDLKEYKNKKYQEQLQTIEILKEFNQPTTSIELTEPTNIIPEISFNSESFTSLTENNCLPFNEINSEFLDYPIYIEQHDLSTYCNSKNTSDLASTSIEHNNLSTSYNTIDNLGTTALSDITPVDIIGIFSNQLINLKSQNITPVVPKQQIPRLKTAMYGEVLTTDEVMTRLKEAETKKSDKQQKKGLRGRPKKKLPIQIDDDQIEKTMEIDFHNQSLEENYDDVANDNGLEEIEYQTPIWSDIKPGCFLLVDFIGGLRKKTHFKYVCLVKTVDEDDGEITVQGLKKEDDYGAVFSFIDNDISTITPEMIIAMLPHPNQKQQGRKTMYVFQGFVTVKEK